MRAAVGKNRAVVEGVFELHEHLARALHNLEGIRHVHQPWHAGSQAFRFGVCRGSRVIVLLLPGQRRRLIWKIVALNHALTRWYALLRRMILNVEVGGVHDLPETREVRLAIRGARDDRCDRSLSEHEHCYERSRNEYGHDDHTEFHGRIMRYSWIPLRCDEPSC